MTELDIYEKQNFGNLSGIGSNPALLIVDFVNGFTDPNQFGGGNINDAINKTSELSCASSNITNFLRASKTETYDVPFFKLRNFKYPKSSKDCWVISSGINFTIRFIVSQSMTTNLTKKIHYKRYLFTHL